MHISFETADMSRLQWQALEAFCAVYSGRTDSVAALASGVEPDTRVAELESRADTVNLFIADLNARMTALEEASDITVATPAVAYAAAPPPPTNDAGPGPGAATVPASASDTAIADAVAAASAAGATFDAIGLPWDARIHASTKTTNKDGSWRTGRGVSAETFAAVTAELKALMTLPLVEVEVDEEQEPAVTDEEQEPAVTDEEQEPAVTDAAVAFGTGVAPPPPPLTDTGVAAVSPFGAIMKKVTARQAAGTLTTKQVMGIAGQLGLSGVLDLAKRPDMIPAFEALLP